MQLSPSLYLLNLGNFLVFFLILHSRHIAKGERDSVFIYWILVVLFVILGGMCMNSAVSENHRSTSFYPLLILSIFTKPLIQKKTVWCLSHTPFYQSPVSASQFLRGVITCWSMQSHVNCICEMKLISNIS